MFFYPFPKNQRFIFGQRLADRAPIVLELLVEAAYSTNKQRLLERASRELEVLRWPVRMATDHGLLTKQQYLYCRGLLVECGRMVGGWLKQTSEKGRHVDASPQGPV